MSWHAKINNIKRILQELQIISDCENELRDDGIIIYALNDDIYQYSVCLTFSQQYALYAGQSYFLRMQLPDDYPCHAPSIQFVSQIFHPNVNQRTGMFCPDFYAPKQWSARNTMQSFIYAVYFLVLNPMDSVIENRAAHELYFESLDKFTEQAAIVSGLNANGAYIEQTFSLPEATNTKYERSRYLQKANEAKQFVKLTYYQTARPQTTKWVGKKSQISQPPSYDSFAFLYRGIISQQLTDLAQRDWKADFQASHRLLYSSCGAIKVRDGVSRRTKTSIVHVQYDDFRDIDYMVTSSVHHSIINNQNRARACVYSAHMYKPAVDRSLTKSQLD